MTPKQTTNSKSNHSATDLEQSNNEIKIEGVLFKYDKQIEAWRCSENPSFWIRF